MNKVLYVIGLIVLMTAIVFAGTKKTCVATYYAEKEIHAENGVYVVDRITTHDAYGNPGWAPINGRLEILVYDTHVTINAKWHHEYTIIANTAEKDFSNPNLKWFRTQAVDEEGIKCMIQSGTFKDSSYDEFGATMYEYFKVTYNNRFWSWQVYVDAVEETSEWSLPQQ